VRDESIDLLSDAQNLLAERFAALGRHERVVTALDNEQAGAGQRLDDWTQFVGRSEPVTRTLNEKHGIRDFRQVRCSELRWFSGRMQGITKEHEACDGAETVLGGHLGRNAPSHRLASNNERALRIFLRTNGLNNRPPCRFEDVVSVGGAAPRMGVEEIECDNVETSRQKCIGHPDHPGMGLPSACSVRQDDRGARFLGRVKERRAGSPSDTKVEPLSLHDRLQLLRDGRRR
jgi:hypothetical protein